MDIKDDIRNKLDQEFRNMMAEPQMSGNQNQISLARKEFNEMKNNSNKLSAKSKMNKPIAKLSSIGKLENKEATSASSAGQFSAPLFSEKKKTEIDEMMQVPSYKRLEKILDIIKENDPEAMKEIMGMIMSIYNEYDSQDVEDLLKSKNSKSLSKVREKQSEIDKEKKGNLTIDDLVEKYMRKGKSVSQIEKQIRTNLKKGTKVEMEHTKDKKVAEKIAMDHLYEDLEYYTKLKKIESKEATSSSSSGQYSTPKMWAKSMNKKDFRGASKTQIPGGKFVTVKEKCRKFPYCNQGDIKALNIFENKTLENIIENIERKYNIPRNIIINSIKSELNKK
jgi:hypothetical protein